MPFGRTGITVKRSNRLPTMPMSMDTKRDGGEKGTISTALTLTLSYMGTTALAVGAGLLVFIIPTLIRLRREGWSAVKATWIGDAGWGLAIAAVIWIGLFIFCLG